MLKKKIYRLSKRHDKAMVDIYKILINTGAFSWQESDFVDYVQKNEIILLIAEYQKICIGGLLLDQSVPGQSEILVLGVDRKHLRKGYGEALWLYYKENFLMDETTVFLEVRSSNLPAQSLYKKLGFQLDGVRKKYYSDGEDALLMSYSP
jgi:ribosomal-protein-alanine N-acetyltransferase